MDVDLSTDLAALLPLVAPLLSGHSDLAIGTRLARGAHVTRSRQARADLAQLQPAAARRAARPVQRRPVRLQGDPRRRRADSCCRSCGTRSGSSTPSCWCSPSAAGCGSTRCRSTGSRTRTRAWTSSPPRSRDLRGVARLLVTRAPRPSYVGLTPPPDARAMSTDSISYAARRLGAAARCAPRAGCASAAARPPRAARPARARGGPEPVGARASTAGPTRTTAPRCAR